MTTGEILFAIISGLAINECCEISPWAARRLVRWSARYQYENPDRAAIRAEELTATINDVPGNLLKLATAFGFVSRAIVATGYRAFSKIRVVTEVNRLLRFGTRRRRLLIVDDMVGHVLADILRDYDCTVVSSVEEWRSLTCAGDLAFDAAIVDTHLSPSMDDWQGLVVARFIRDRTRIPTLLMSEQLLYGSLGHLRQRYGVADLFMKSPGASGRQMREALSRIAGPPITRWYAFLAPLRRTFGALAASTTARVG
jgi:hypothetical protein